MIQKASSRGKSRVSTAELYSFPRSEPHSHLQQATPSQHCALFVCRFQLLFTLWRMHIKPQNHHILTQGQQEHPLDCLQEQLSTVPHCLHYFCSISPPLDNAKDQVSAGLFTNHVIRWVRGFLQKQGHERRQKALQGDKGKTSGKRNRRGMQWRLNETSTAQRPRYTK